MQFVNTILERPTPDVNVLWNERSFAPAVEFLDISGGKRAAMEEAPVFVSQLLPAEITSWFSCWSTTMGALR